MPEASADPPPLSADAPAEAAMAAAPASVAMPIVLPIPPPFTLDPLMMPASTGGILATSAIRTTQQTSNAAIALRLVPLMSADSAA
ncbi:hypothetical protein D3C76_1451380 [compost metagenome]